MISWKHLWFFLGILTVSTLAVKGQSAIKDSVLPATLFKVNLGIDWPAGNMAQRFGYNGSVGGAIHYKTKSNWLFGGQGDFIFGGKVKNSEILTHIVTKDGNVLSTEGYPAEVSLAERGFILQAQAGRIFNTLSTNKNSGLLALVSAGFFQHKIRINVDDEIVPHLSEEYRKGYDRLSNGLCYSGLIGYSHLSENKLINYFIGLEVTHGFTRNRRSLNYDTMQKDDDLRSDLLIGLKLGWMLPVYHKSTSKFYYN